MNCNTPTPDNQSSADASAATGQFFSRCAWAEECRPAMVSGRHAIHHPHIAIVTAHWRNVYDDADAAFREANRRGVAPGLVIYGEPSRHQVEFLAALLAFDCRERFFLFFADPPAQEAFLAAAWRLYGPSIFDCEEGRR